MMSEIKMLLIIVCAALSACSDREKDQVRDNISSVPFPPLDHYYLTGQQPFSGKDLVSQVRITGFHKATGLINSYTVVSDIIKRSYALTHYGNSVDGKFSKRPIDFNIADNIMTNVNQAFYDGNLKNGQTRFDTPHTDYLSLTIEVALMDADAMSAEYFFYDFNDLPEKVKYFARIYLTDTLWIPDHASSTNK